MVSGIGPSPPLTIIYNGITLKICQCRNTAGSSERNLYGIITHGEKLGGCGLIRRSVVFECAACQDPGVSKKVDYARPNTDYYCDWCRKEYGF